MPAHNVCCDQIFLYESARCSSNPSVCPPLQTSWRSELIFQRLPLYFISPHLFIPRSTPGRPVNDLYTCRHLRDWELVQKHRSPPWGITSQRGVCLSILMIFYITLVFYLGWSSFFVSHQHNVVSKMLTRCFPIKTIQACLTDWFQFVKSHANSENNVRVWRKQKNYTWSGKKWWNEVKMFISWCH